MISDSERRLLAYEKCQTCYGCGLRELHRGLVICRCVYRAIARQVLRRVRERHSSVDARRTGTTWEMQERDYAADAELLARRVLEPIEYQLWKLYHLEEQGWAATARRLNVERGELYRLVYRIEAKYGQAAADMRPYPLWPACDYFRPEIASGPTWETTLICEGLQRGNRPRRAVVLPFAVSDRKQEVAESLIRTEYAIARAAAA